MQKEPGTPVEIVEDDVPDVGEVDAKLVALALARSRAILTNDFNLNRVAELQGVRVMNINSLANAVKPAVLPGEELRVRVIQEGKEAGPGRRLPRRRDDDRRRGRRPPHRQGARRGGHPRPPDRRRPDDLRPAAARLSAIGPSPPRRRDRRRGRLGSARMGGTDKLAAEIGGRPLLAWTLAALAAAPRGRADRRRHVGRPRRGCGGRRRWLPASRRRRRRRRRTPPGVGPRRVRRARSRSTRTTPAWSSSTTAARPLVDPALVAAVADAAAAPRRGDPGRAGRRDPQADRRRRWSGRRSTATGLGAAQTPQGVRRDLLRGAYAPLPADGPRDFDRRGRAARGLQHRRPCRPRRTGQPQGDRARRPRAGRGRRSAAGAPTARPGSATTAIRSGRAARCGSAGSRSPARPRLHGHSDGDVVAPRASPTRCSGRPGWATSAGCSRPTSGRRAASPARELAGGRRRPRSRPRAGGRRRST